MGLLNGGFNCSGLFIIGNILMILRMEYQQCEEKGPLPVIHPVECKLVIKGVRKSHRREHNVNTQRCVLCIDHVSPFPQAEDTQAHLIVSISLSFSGMRSASLMTRGSSYGPSRSAMSTKTSGYRTTGWPPPSCTATRLHGSSSRCASPCGTAPACDRRRPPAERR